MNHSPAPWKWRDDIYDPPHLVDANENFVIYLGASAYPDDPGGCGHKPDPEDAALIAAAPDLLEACKAMMQICEQTLGSRLHNGLTGGNTFLTTAIEQGKAAIAKAELIESNS